MKASSLKVLPKWNELDTHWSVVQKDKQQIVDNVLKVQTPLFASVTVTHKQLVCLKAKQKRKHKQVPRQKLKTSSA